MERVEAAATILALTDYSTRVGTEVNRCIHFELLVVETLTDAAQEVELAMPYH